MTDELMDARLHGAGERWRGANSAAAHLPQDTDHEMELLPPPTVPTRRWITAASAALLAAALIIGGIVFAAHRGTRPGRPAAIPVAAAALTGHTWALSDDPHSTLVFTANSVRVEVAGCMKYTVATTVAGNHLTLGDRIGKGIACKGPRPGAPTERMNEVLGLLTGELTWSVSGNQLTLTKSDGSTIGTLVYTSGTAPSLTLVDPLWRLTKIVKRDGSTQAVGGKATIKISGEQQLTGDDGCNAIGGQVQVRSDTVIFGQMGGTEMACPDPVVTATAATVDAFLSGTVRYSINGEELTLTKAGAGSLTYRAAKADVPITDPAALTGKAWTLTGIEETSGNSSSGSSAFGLSRVQFDGRGGFTVQHRCDTNKGKAIIGTGTAQVSNVTLKLALPCPSLISAAQKREEAENGVVDSALDGAVTWSIKGNQLTITKQDHALTFAGDASPVTLIGPTWQLKTLDQTTGTGKNATTSHRASLWSTTLSFDGMGSLTIARCYVGTADVQIGETTLDVSNSRITKALPCPSGPNGLREQNHLIDSVLAGTVKWSISGRQLTITKGGVGALVLTTT